MFALRNIGTPAAVDALASGCSDDNTLFKHEIAFIFGHILSPHSVPSLLKVLQNVNESDMVRHEAAEALGEIGTPEVLPHLKEWMKKYDAPRVVKESCQAAVDMWENNLFCKECQYHSISNRETKIAKTTTVCRWTGILISSRKAGLAMEQVSAKILPSDRSPFHKNVLLQGWARIEMKRFPSGTSPALLVLRRPRN
ncbi:hypothetical protein AGABI2DRAFT_119601 [Agaricus bisporus var. bisporus H97]|uniref:hypothetical protein n=1 Tax=Agaricus bisporus var. bisporus (strain H97 / ATCC MYA-4626 / FGSC 10389) TaxID=936046 RepID=UPI00029F763F|nr:hypothetical protein AGABI2DRAFT_119601 [Agaricus bisporus var. bisporus H97]EKV45938.1 hypothetical protein AGABI2DRAFT_119601 [Agaricus bisporus var. bisporus H97]